MSRDQPAEALRDAIKTGRVPGLVAAVVGEGSLQEVGATGVDDVRTRRAMTTASSLLWFSMTKIVTATAAMRLVDTGSLSLDDVVDSWVPGVLPATAAESVQVRHLLQHSSGLPNPIPIRWVRPATVPAPEASAFLHERFRHVRRLRFEPGSRAAYTNLGYLLLGEVIAAASGEPFVDHVRRSVLQPLGMGSTDFVIPTGDVATGHQRLARGLGPTLQAVLPRGIVAGRTGPWLRFAPFLVNGAPYGGLVGPVADAAQVVLLHANRGEVDGNRVLSEAAVEAMHTISLRGRRFDHGLGWFRPVGDDDRDYVEHYGGGAGYHNLMRLYPEQRVGAVVMGNSTSYDVDAVVDALAAPHL